MATMVKAAMKLAVLVILAEMGMEVEVQVKVTVERG